MFAEEDNSEYKEEDGLRISRNGPEWRVMKLYALRKPDTDSTMFYDRPLSLKTPVDEDKDCIAKLNTIKLFYP